MMWGNGGGWGPWLGMGFGMILFWGLVIGGIVALVHYLGTTRVRHGSGGGAEQPGPEQVLAERFARGEIDEDDYRQRREVLRDGR